MKKAASFLFSALSVLFLCSSCLFMQVGEPTKSPEAVDTAASVSENSQPPEPSEPPVPEPVTVRLKAVGDIPIHSSIY